MARPLVAIVGRPNVGKSTFFNKISGKRISIVEDTPGVTRDRIYADVEWMGRKFTLIDTGGIDPHSEDVLLGQMRRQAEIAMDTADVICFFTDARSGLTQDDDAVANLLRKTHKPVLLVVNKVDFAGLNDAVYEFYNLGLGRSHPDQQPEHAGSWRSAGGDRQIAAPQTADDMEEDAHVIQLADGGPPQRGQKLHRQ